MMNINVNTMHYKVKSYKDGSVNVLNVLDLGDDEAYQFFCDKDVADKVDSARNANTRLVFSGYTYKSKTTGNYNTALSSIKSEDGDIIYAYKKG